MANYGSLVGPSLTFAGVDQGIDFTGSGSVYALGDGIVTRVIRHGSGWPGEGAVLVYKITRGPAKGRFVYIAEDFAPASGIHIGSHLKAGQVVGSATGSGSAPGIEIGWANAAGRPVAPLGKNKRAATAAGQSFLKFVQSAALTTPDSAPAQTGSAESAAGSPVAMPDYSQNTPVGAAPATGAPFFEPGSIPAGDFVPRRYAEMWQQLATQPGATPETLNYAKLASG